MSLAFTFSKGNLASNKFVNNKVASKNRHLSINMNFDYAQNEKWKDFISQGIAAGNKYIPKNFPI